MATTEAQFSVSPDRVFAVLSDPASYADWVVGSHSVRDADPTWPEVGARFYHRVGAGPMTVSDHTEVLAVDPSVGWFCVRGRVRSAPQEWRSSCTRAPGART